MENKQFTAKDFTEAMEAPTVTAKSPPPETQQTLPITLIVAPVSVLSNWQEQVETHVAPYTLRTALYQGPDRHHLLHHANDFDIWVTSYSTLQADFRPLDAVRKAKQAGGGDSTMPNKKARTGFTLFDLLFFRVILDEAHQIRNPKSSTFRACAALQAERRWCLTGTPLTNRPDVRAFSPRAS
jgi:SWI/SNF-related matrix-associated actin-dependent regulator of chromatin subfamily A3